MEGSISCDAGQANLHLFLISFVSNMSVTIQAKILHVCMVPRGNEFSRNKISHNADQRWFIGLGHMYGIRTCVIHQC
jgi:hypothetical protein